MSLLLLGILAGIFLAAIVFGMALGRAAAAGDRQLNERLRERDDEGLPF